MSELPLFDTKPPQSGPQPAVNSGANGKEEPSGSYGSAPHESAMSKLPLFDTKPPQSGPQPAVNSGANGKEEPSGSYGSGSPQLTESVLRKALNDRQYEAVVATDGPLLILAGAGSGKTRVITYRIAWLVANGAHPSCIMALTFTNKAAGEMKERAKALIGQRKMDLWISTFHAACLRILRKDADRIGFPKDFIVYDSTDQIRLIKACLKELGLPEKENPARQISSFISRFKNKRKSAEEAAKELNVHRHKNFLRIFALYEKRLSASRVMDFDDLLNKTVTLLKSHDDVRNGYIERFSHLMVDEFQDTNSVQYEMIKLLTGEKRNICVVGDDDQSIYQWRGATAENILHFERDYPEATVVALEQNYRSTRTILDGANAVVARNPLRKEKKLWTENDVGQKISLYTATDETDEAYHVVKTVRSLIAHPNKNLSDIAVFYRTNSQSRAIEDALRREGLLYKIYGGLKFYERREVKDILAYFRSALNPYDAVAFKRIVNTPPRGIGSVTVEKLEAAAISSGVSLMAALDDIDAIERLNSGAKKKLGAFREIMKTISHLATQKSAPEAISQALTVTGYLDYLANEKNSEAEGRMENLEELVSAAEDFVEQADDASLLSFLDQAALVSDADSVDETSGSVKLMTVHISKGLEFPVVFVTGLEDNVFPHARSKEDPAQMQEERRLMYVAMTRAKEALYLSHATARKTFGVAQYNNPSPFLLDIPSELLDSKRSDNALISSTTRAYDNSFSPKSFKTASSTSVKTARASGGAKKSSGGEGFPLGAKVRHPSFQVGIIRNVEGKGESSRITVYFPRFGEKKLVKKFAKLELV